MSMDTWAVTADIVPAELVEKVCPAEYKAFMAFADEDVYSLFQQASYDDFEDEKGEAAATTLCEAFKQQTGLDLYMGYLDEDTGERTDDFRGDYFHLGGTRTKTPEALAFEAAHGFTIETQHSTDWG